MGPPDGPEDLLAVLARAVAEGNDWAVKVEQWRQANPGRALTEKHRARLREMRAEFAKRKLTATDEADAQAIVAAYAEAYRRIISDRDFVPLTGHHADAAAILPDARRLADRAKRGNWRPTPAEVVAHRLESYLREPRNKRDGFRLKWIFDRTEQDDLPKPPARAAPKEVIPEGPVGARAEVRRQLPPPPDVLAKWAKKA